MLAATAAGGQEKGKNIKQARDRVQWVSKGRCSRRAKVRLQAPLGEKEKRSQDDDPKFVATPHTSPWLPWERARPKGTRPGGKQNQAVESKSQERRKYQGKGPRFIGIPLNARLSYVVSKHVVMNAYIQKYMRSGKGAGE